MQWKELYLIVLSAAAWGHRWSTLRIRLFCDNEAVAHCLVSATSHCPHLMSLLCSLFLVAAKHKFYISAQHLPATHSIIADSLSFSHASVLDTCPTSLSPSHSTPSLTSFHGQLNYYMQHSLAPSTRTSYSSAQCCFIHFALLYNRLYSNGSLIPASEETYAVCHIPNTHPQTTVNQTLPLCTAHIAPRTTTYQTPQQMPSTFVASCEALSGSMAPPLAPDSPSLSPTFLCFPS